MNRILSLDEVASESTPDRLVGRKAASLGRLIALGLPVPSGFVATTEVWRELERHGSLGEPTRDQVRLALSRLEVQTQRRLGDPSAPLLLAVRSGAPVSMPGMLETVLDVGITREVVEALGEGGANERFALDCERRFLSGFASTVLGVPAGRLESVVEARKYARGTPRVRDAELDAEDLRHIVREQRALVEREVGIEVPADPFVQLELAIVAVFRSWHLPRAVRYRRMQGYGDRLGTACVIQRMAFGNRGDRSCAGVLFTRNPSTGEGVVSGEYMPRGQGTDVVGGTQRPLRLELLGAAPGFEQETMQRRMPDVHAELERMARVLERAEGDAQEVEFAVEEGQVHFLQARPAKRTAEAAIRVAMDLVREGIVDEQGAVDTLEPTTFASLIRRRLPSREALHALGIDPVAVGLAACPGSATGRLVATPDQAVRLAAAGEDVVLVRRDTSPEDVHGVKAAVALLTTAGGLTSHAAVVARGLGKPCVAGCSGVHVDESDGTVTFRSPEYGTHHLRVGDLVTIDGSSGAVYGQMVEATVHGALPELDTLVGWANERRALRVDAVAESVTRALAALRDGADGVGLFVCDSLLLEESAAHAARVIAVAEDEGDEGRDAELRLEHSIAVQLRPLVEAAEGRSLVLRLFDDVLGDLLAEANVAWKEVARDAGESLRDVERRCAQLRPSRKGLGLRGVRLALVIPGFMRALVRGILRARQQFGGPSAIEIVVPAVASGRELAALLGPLRDLLRQPGRADLSGADLPIGSIVGFPHACLEAGEIARLSERLVFDTHELTQSVFGMSREDARSYLSRYIHELHIFDGDPFVRFDETGVGLLIRTGTEQAREAHPGIRLSIAGEVAGEPAAVRLAKRYAMHGVACPADRLTVARIAAAQRSVG